MELNGKNVTLAKSYPNIRRYGNRCNLGHREMNESSYRINLVVNENKIKYLVMTRQVLNKAALKVDPLLV